MSTIRVGTYCHAVRERDFALLGDWAADVTSEGMLVRSDAAVIVGETVLVSFRVPPMGTWVDAEARAVRVCTDESGQRCVELAFDTLDELWQTVLCEVVLDHMLESFAKAS